MQSGVFVRGFIAGPSDVNPERDIAARVIAEWNAVHSLDHAAMIEPVRMETHARPALGKHPQDIINGQLLERCDFLVAIFWHRLGTPTASAPSGTIQEINEFVESKGGDRVMLFFSTRPIPQDATQFDDLKQFKKGIQSEALYVSYSDGTDFEAKFRQKLEILMNQTLSSETPPAAESGTAKLSLESSWLLMHAAADSDGRIICLRTRDGGVSTAGREFISPDDARSEATWHGAVDDLENHDLIQPTSFNREVFLVAAPGYKAADELWGIFILKVLDSLQEAPFQPIPAQTIGEALKLTDATELERHLHSLASAGLIEPVASDTGIAAARLANEGRTKLKPHSAVEYSHLP